MIKELIKKKEQKTLKIFSKSTTDFGRIYKFNPDFRAEEISEKLIEIAKKNLSQHGFSAICDEMAK